MRVFGLVSVLLLSTAAPLKSEQTHNRSNWEAVGRLNISGRTMCTGALIAPDLVVTAAHCMFDPTSGKSVAATDIVFDAGLHNGHVKARRKVQSATIHPAYRHKPRGQADVGSDLAVLKLKKPISAHLIRPFATDARPNRGDTVGVVSYTMDQATTQSVEHPCQVLARQHDTLVMSCKVEFGASGAPVFAVQGESEPRLVSVISSKAQMGNRRVSVGTAVDDALQVLLNDAS
ncbi:Trypsin [Shimia gijangensis]|uniref:Trypsin n=1 Tax=Shimia gijangensis TaxID=1470563 RepID=A0A1M6LVQ5_9RHOB|nr:trypsin-like serine protease [Shimia gijangensis]SHJ75225.1 Trypsin [Shimia gijangensis]